MEKRFAGLCFATLLIGGAAMSFADNGWYTEGDYVPTQRIAVTITNPLGVDRPNCPITVKRTSLPDQNIKELFLTPVDPSLPSNPEPSATQLANIGAEVFRKETNGHIVEYQLDDLDQDGIWDELFFLTDLKANQTKTMYIYIGFTERGLNAHKTHAGMGYYGRHMVPFWEAEYIGWKLWYPTDVDMHGKRTPMLTAYPEYQGNLGGYYMPVQMGTDIMAVGNTFGAGGICLVENPANLDSLSRPRFSPFADQGPIKDTRYAFSVIANGPLRSIIRAKTTNWNSGHGNYELSQTYTAIAHKSYALCSVEYDTFLPDNSSTLFGCGIREIMKQNKVFQQGGLVISFGKDVNPYPIPTYAGSTIVPQKEIFVSYEAIAMVVKDSYKPQYRNVKSELFLGNHVFEFPTTQNKSYEYMIAGAWCDGAVNNTPEEFTQYVVNESKLYNNPVQMGVGALETK